MNETTLNNIVNTKRTGFVLSELKPILVDLLIGILERINVVLEASYSFNSIAPVSLNSSLRPSSLMRATFMDLSAFSPLLMKTLPSLFLMDSYNLSKSFLVSFLASLILIA